MRKISPMTDIERYFAKKQRIRKMLATHSDPETFLRYMKKNGFQQVNSHDVFRVLHNMGFTIGTASHDEWQAYKAEENRLCDRFTEAGLDCSNIIDTACVPKIEL